MRSLAMNISVGRPVVVVLGAGDVGSAVALLLHRAGTAVVLCDEVDPAWLRRGMAFTNAWYLGGAELGGEAAMFCASVKSIPAVLDRHRLIAATTWSWRGVAQALGAVALVDARLRKRNKSADLRSGALTTIGLGPGFIAGANVDVAIETAWGDRLGAVIDSGPTLSFVAHWPAIGGAARERFVYAPAAGRFTTNRRIAGRVLKGELVGAVGAQIVTAPLDGVLRGLTARGARVGPGTKILEVDPRGDPALCYGPEERPLAIARGVLAALADRGVVDAAAEATAAH
jgi:xanthine dehydrogenase accessory factor